MTPSACTQILVLSCDEQAVADATGRARGRARYCSAGYNLAWIQDPSIGASTRQQQSHFLWLYPMTPGIYGSPDGGVTAGQSAADEA